MNTPHNWRNPDFNNTCKVHDWLNYASYELAGIWDSFSDEQKQVISANLQDLADREDWE